MRLLQFYYVPSYVQFWLEIKSSGTKFPLLNARQRQAHSIYIKIETKYLSNKDIARPFSALYDKNTQFAVVLKFVVERLLKIALPCAKFNAFIISMSNLTIFLWGRKSAVALQ